MRILFTTFQLVAKGVRSIRHGHLTDTLRTPEGLSVRGVWLVLVRKTQTTDTYGHLLQYSPHTRIRARTHMSAMSQKVSVGVRGARKLARNGIYKRKLTTDTFIPGIRAGIRGVSVVKSGVAQ